MLVYALGGGLDGTWKTQTSSANLAVILIFPKMPKPPKSYEVAIEFSSSFIQISSDAIFKDPTAGNETLGIPCVKWFYPLVLNERYR